MNKKAPARERLLKAAAEMFYDEGLGTTGIDAITARAGVAKMSLYNNFSSKADLVQAYIQARCDQWKGLLDERLRHAKTADERVLAVFDSYLDHAALAQGSGFRGCGMYNAAAELRAGDPGRALVVAQKDEVEDLFRRYLREMGLAATTVDRAAEHLSFLLEGAMSRAGLEGNDDRLKAARRIARAMLDGLR